MSNMARLLKDEIRRIARSEVKSQTAKLKRDVVRAKKSNVILRRSVAQLKRDNELFMSAEKRRQGLPVVVAPEDTKSARITAKGIRAMRRKLGLSQGDFAKLAGVSTVAVGLWEHKGSGAMRLRDKTKAGILALRGLGAREAKRRLELID